MQHRTDTLANALWHAAHTGDESLVERLLAEGVDVNTWDKYGRSALAFAAAAGHLPTAQILVQAGAWVDPHEDGDLYSTPLMAAAENGRLEVVEYLLDRGANPTLYGGFNHATAEYYARGTHPFVAAILRRAEDKWRISRRP